MPKDRLSIDVGLTLNMGDYSSLRANVGVERDKLEGESVKDGFKAIMGEVLRQLEVSLKDMLKAFDKMKEGA